MQTGMIYINNSWRKAAGSPFASVNPANGDPLWEGHAASQKDVDDAVLAARTAFPSWSSLPVKERAEYLYAYARVLKDRQNTLAEIISQEIGKPLWESLTEVNAMIQKIDISVDAQNTRAGTTVHNHPMGMQTTRHRPHGATAIFGPYNFPGHLPNGHLVPALLAGNTAVFKPSELAPLAGEEMVRCWEAAGLPCGVINMLQGGRETGASLASHPDIDGLFFTGSFGTGQHLLKQFSTHPEKILALEMGGNNPLVVDTISDVEAAAYMVIQSAYLTTGQRCTCARRLIIVGNLADRLLDMLIEKIHRIKAGAYTDIPEPFMGPVVSVEAASRLLKAQNALIAQGAHALLPMTRLKPEGAFLTPGLLDITAIANRADEELFGPLLQVIRVNSFEEALKEAASTSYGLAAGLLSDSKEQYDAFRSYIKAGVINWNVPLTGASSQAPFGGVGHSGNFRPSAYYAVDYCNFPVASIEAGTLKIPEKLPPGLSS